MKNILLKLKTIDYRHYICIGITITFTLLSIFVFKHAFPRLIESFIDLGTSTKYYISELFELNLQGKITINDFTKQPFVLPWNLPNTWEEFKVLCKDYGELLITKENFINYLNWVGDLLYYLSKILIMIMPFIVLIIMLLNREIKQNNDYNKDTKALKIWKQVVERKIYLPVKEWIKEFIFFNKRYSFYSKIWLFIFLLSYNGITIFVEFIAYYLYFVASFDLVSLYVQFLKLLMDLSIWIDNTPLIIKAIIYLKIFDVIRRKIGYKNLNHFENKNRGFINERPIVIMLCGTMGSKKTTMITDIALSQEIMLRDKAFEKILECDLKFPFFPWINLENSLKKAIYNHSVYNLATARRFIKSKKYKWYKKPNILNIFGYNFERYGLTYDNKLNVVDIWKVLEDYAQLYFVYIIQSSLLISNYSIRTDNVLEDLGNFPLWNTELFKKDSRYIDAYSRHAHIIDFDSLRLGKKVIEDNKNADLFEFGVINITEIGKERGNNLELQTIKKNDDSTNQKNDLFNSWLKMVRHSATIDNFPFVKVICDEQRPESWGADARDLCEIVRIEECAPLNISMPFFALEDLVSQITLEKFQNRYYSYRFNRSDNTLPMYLYHGCASLLNKYLKGIYNTFGFYKLDVTIESGRQDGKLKENHYYLMTKKIYSKRFSTDCFSDYFNEKALRSQIGLDDLDEFASEKATFEEMKKENSYFFNDLTKLRDKDKTE